MKMMKNDEEVAALGQRARGPGLRQFLRHQDPAPGELVLPSRLPGVRCVLVGKQRLQGLTTQ